MQTNVLIKEECILKNKNKLYPYKKLSVFYNTCLKTFGSHLVLHMELLMYVNHKMHDIHLDFTGKF